MRTEEDKPWKQKTIKKIPRALDQSLLNACYFGNLQGVYKFLKLGADPNYMEERDGWRPLHYAARWGNIQMALLLLSWGANINGLTNSKETALHKCARWNRKELALLLINKGALLHFKNTDGCKAIDMNPDKEMKLILEPH